MRKDKSVTEANSDSRSELGEESASGRYRGEGPMKTLGLVSISQKGKCLDICQEQGTGNREHRKQQRKSQLALPWASLVAQTVTKNPSARHETQVLSLGNPWRKEVQPTPVFFVLPWWLRQ